MLMKLLKYDLKWSYRHLVIFYISTLLFALFTRFFLSFDNSTIFDIIGKICAGVTISLIVNILINNFTRVWVRFTRNIYGDESYLTHTLPVNRKDVYLSKTLLAIITMFTSILVILISLFLCYYSKENLDIIKSFLEIVASTYDSTVLGLMIAFGITFFLEMVVVLLTGFMGIIIGHSYNHGKVLKSVLFSFLIYFMVQTLTLIAIFIFGLFNADIMSLFTSNDPFSSDTIKLILAVAIILYSVYIVVIDFINRKLFNKGINID